MSVSAARLALEASAHPLPRPAGDVLDDLESFARLLQKWQYVQNLVSRETLDHVWDRHIADSLQLLRYLPALPLRMVDVGSGGGFPAIPLAIALKGSGAASVLVEPNTRKAAFLKTVARDLGLAARIVNQRAGEQLSPEIADVVTARAVAPLPVLFGLILPFFGPTTRALLHKGRDYRGEIAAADADWRYDMVVHPSVTDAAGVVLEISRLAENRR